jgi:hypothetical protein
MGMLEPNNGARLAQEAVQIVFAQSGMQHLYRCLALEIHVLPQIDRREAAFAQRANQAVVPQLLAHAISHCDSSPPRALWECGQSSGTRLPDEGMVKPSAGGVKGAELLIRVGKRSGHTSPGRTTGARCSVRPAPPLRRSLPCPFQRALVGVPGQESHLRRCWRRTGYGLHPARSAAARPLHLQMGDVFVERQGLLNSPLIRPPGKRHMPLSTPVRNAAPHQTTQHRPAPLGNWPIP